MEEKVIKWNLDDILKPEEFDVLYKKTEEYIGALNLMFENNVRPGMSGKDFKEYTLLEDLLIENLNKLSGFHTLIEATDTQSEQALLLKSKAKNLFTKFNESYTRQCLFFQGIKVKGKTQLKRDSLIRLLKAVPEMSYVSLRESELGEYMLTGEEETLDAAKDMNGTEVLKDLREKISSDFRFNFKPKGAEETKVIETIEELNSYRTSSNPDEREESYKLLLEKHKENLHILFPIYEAIAKDWAYMAKRRKYNSPIEMRNKENYIPDQAIKTLLKTCRDNREVYQDYFRWKAKELGMEKLRRYDLRAPLKKAEMKIPYQEAVDIVLETFNGFSKGFADRAKEIIDAGHIDSHPYKNKISGAFCYTVSPRIAPYVLLNYTGTLNDVSTLAHELGHGIHSLYAKNHLCLTQDPILPLAETASTLGEMIIFEKLFEKASEEDKKCMLSDKLAESYSTIMRQSYFTEFEIRAHEVLAKGVTAEELSDTYFETLKEQFGDSVDIDPLFRYEWAYVSHFVDSPFYCYAYNFGDLLSLSLYSTYKARGKEFIPTIERILEAGGSKNPDELLHECGFDFNSQEFWQGSFNIIKGWQDQLKHYQITQAL